MGPAIDSRIKILDAGIPLLHSSAEYFYAYQSVMLKVEMPGNVEGFLDRLTGHLDDTSIVFEVIGD